MGVFKRGRNYWYEFEFRGQRVRESAHTPNRELARSIERNRRRAMEESAGGIKRTKPILFRKAVRIKPDGGIEATPTLLGHPLGPKELASWAFFRFWQSPLLFFDNALQEVSEVLLSLEKARPTVQPTSIQQVPWPKHGTQGQGFACFGRNSPYGTIAIIIAMLVGGERT